MKGHDSQKGCQMCNICGLLHGSIYYYVHGMFDLSKGNNRGYNGNPRVLTNRNQRANGRQVEVEDDWEGYEEEDALGEGYHERTSMTRSHKPSWTGRE